ncbi:hypothetical protein GCM10017044_13940 [Kordiimonas sediminis]|uniref:Solute-binding protein family 3/N-terminal domain-containing protein n=1 Tax=Kordiimonas sediminis TaxID=1735581 RepID=A0A919AQB0_9PROT|nr:transporter substrate-binding domain-containing protein [Kordiimonas sediminis]GHF20312.1 hypothetical protein GCM10017044_13940 [Kordiimonas sediminis]
MKTRKLRSKASGLICILLISLAGMQNPVAADQTIRFLAQDAEPKYIFRDSLGGLCGELYSEIAERIGAHGFQAELPSVGVPIKRILMDLRDGRGHVYCGAGGRHTEREQLYIFSKEPIYKITMVAVKRADDPLSLKRIENLTGDNALILTPFGTSTASWLQSHKQLKVDDQFRDVEHAISLVAGGRWGRVFYYHDLAAIYAIRRQGLGDRTEMLAFEHNSFDQWMLYSRHLPREKRDAIEGVIADMRADGTLRRITSEYILYKD